MRRSYIDNVPGIEDGASNRHRFRLSGRDAAGTGVTPENLNQRLLILRQSLGDNAARPRYVESVRGQGCRPVADVTVLPPQTYLDQAIALDESFARAYAGKALIQIYSIINVGDVVDDPAVTTAADLEPSLTEQRFLSMPAVALTYAGVSATRRAPRCSSASSRACRAGVRRSPSSRASGACHGPSPERRHGARKRRCRARSSTQ